MRRLASFAALAAATTLTSCAELAPKPKGGARVVRRRQFLFVRGERASDILQVLDLRREFPGLELVLVRVSEAGPALTASRRQAFR